MTKDAGVSPRKGIWVVAFLVDILLAGVLFVLFNALPLPPVVPCTHPLAQNFVLALILALVCQLLLGAKIAAWWQKAFSGLSIALLPMALWLGSYPFSPLGFSQGRIPLLNGFLVRTAARGAVHVAPGGVVEMSVNSIAAISPALLPGAVRCDWLSSNGGALDDSQSCDVSYMAPAADYDILKISLRPGCGLPASVAQLKISILP